jgi:hypothetical protein
MKYNYLVIILCVIAVIAVISNYFTNNTGNGIVQRGKEGFFNGQLPDFENENENENENKEFYFCNNFCGPKAECAITREQCVKDSDCSNCNNNNNNISEGFSNNTNTKNKMYDSMETSSLTTDTSTFATVIEKNALIPKMYLGTDLWTKSFNYGLGLSENKLQYDIKRHPDAYKNMPKYQVSETVTGMFYDTGPIAANADIF